MFLEFLYIALLLEKFLIRSVLEIWHSYLISLFMMPLFRLVYMHGGQWKGLEIDTNFIVAILIIMGFPFTIRS